MGSSNTLFALKSLLDLKTNIYKYICFVYLYKSPNQSRRNHIFFEINTFISYIMTKIWEIKVFDVKKIWVLIGGFVDMDKALLYMPVLIWRSRSDFKAKSVNDDPHWNKKLTKKVKTPINAFKISKNDNHTFLWDTMYVYVRYNLYWVSSTFFSLINIVILRSCLVPSTRPVTLFSRCWKCSPPPPPPRRRRRRRRRAERRRIRTERKSIKSLSTTPCQRMRNL